MLSTSHQVTAKSFWQQRGANITSEGKDHSKHLTPCSTALWETDVGAKWDTPRQGEVFFPYNGVGPTETLVTPLSQPNVQMEYGIP